MEALLENLLNLLRSAPIIPIIIAFSLLRRFIVKKPETHASTDQPQGTFPAPAPEPDDGYGRPRSTSFDDLSGSAGRSDPSIDPVPASTLFGGEYGKTKFGFDESDWDSEFDKKWGDDRDNSPQIHVR